MQLSDTPSSLKQIRETPWKFQQTFKTPLNNLHAFVAAILSTASSEPACIPIEQAVLEPKHGIDLLTRYSLPPLYRKGVRCGSLPYCRESEPPWSIPRCSRRSVT